MGEEDSREETRESMVLGMFVVWVVVSILIGKVEKYWEFFFPWI